ncbi:hypothetical protein HanRHA438_Chr05g0246421 [Helianthus annuus]|uniref:Uncharacterized protein n=1 Tax=Helianthus annuus TaxID=4232 RepID=A0A251UU08_HELAN|nr:hypothetical protein HanXRQr2_Chr05g0237261 [Helianthus annuus]KAJ0579081.1 hypothetical protein HanIR_Chr05g0255011 [Helianthus annuus]KAJ0920906.1 hypothetical protein HanRHA438_Chr05g0246421 [Helianthus annuus]
MRRVLPLQFDNGNKFCGRLIYMFWLNVSMNNHHNGVPSRPVSSTHTLPLPEPKAPFKCREHILPSPEEAHKKISEKGRTNHIYSKRPPG